MSSALHKRLVATIAFGVISVGVVVFAGWSLANTIRPSGIIIHHSAIPPRADGQPIDAEMIDEIHAKRGFRAFYWGHFYHIGYHYVILPNGTIQHGRPEYCKGEHAAGYNSYIGICLVGNFSSKDNPNGERGLMVPTEAQMKALIDLCRRLRARYQIPEERILRNSDVNAGTESPGDRFPFQKFLKTLE
jgi:N-acetylmuramoyl-L-alanine amidase